MADNTKIEWTEATWNPITGCSIASPGCTNCYAMQLAGTRLKHHPSREGLTRESGGRPKWTGEVRFNEQWITQPLKWLRPRMIFVCAHGDLFHENVPDEWIDRVFGIMAGAPQHTFQVLTKRADRMREYVSNLPSRVVRDYGGWGKFGDCYLDGIPHQTAMAWPLPNVWLGVSVEDQQRADARVANLIATPAAVRWLSCEPLLGPVNLMAIQYHPGLTYNALAGFDSEGYWPCRNKLDWVVVGGESGSNARPMHPDWARSLRDQCAKAGTAFFFKQWGQWIPRFDLDLDKAATWLREYPNGRWLNLSGALSVNGERVVFIDRVPKATAGRLLDGVEHNALPVGVVSLDR